MEEHTVGGGDITFKFDSERAKDRFLEIMAQGFRKSDEIKEKNYTCGGCAAQPCFRYRKDSDPAGLCYQTVRLCRQECDYFLKDLNSGKAPEFQITGQCKRDSSQVSYEQECKFN